MPASVQVCKATARSIIELNIGPSIIHRGQLQFKVTPARAGRPKRDARLDAQVPNSLLSHRNATYPWQSHRETSNWKSSGKLHWELDKFTGNLQLGCRLPDRRGERSPCVSGEREHGAAAVGGVADQHGPCCGDFYAFPPLGPE